MKKLVKTALLSFIFAASAHAAGVSASPQPARDILGVRVGMTADAAHAQLQKVGRFQKTERKRHEVWEVRDPHFSHLIIQFDKAKLINFVTAVARADAQREPMRYSDVGELKSAQQKGEAARSNFRYEWGLEAAGTDPKINIVAWGRDPQFLQYYSIERAN